MSRYAVTVIRESEGKDGSRHEHVTHTEEFDNKEDAEDYYAMLKAMNQSVEFYDGVDTAKWAPTRMKFARPRLGISGWGDA